MSGRDAASIQADRLVSQYDSEIQDLIRAARTILRGAFPAAAETVDAKDRLFGYSYGPGYKGIVATLILSKTGVKIGLPYAAALPDPAGLLAGVGKIHRHVAITEPAQLLAPALKVLLKKALSAWLVRTRA